MKAFFEKRFRAGASLIMAGLLLATVVSLPPVPAHAEPVITTVAVTIAGAVVVAIACDVNLFGICPPSNSGTNTGSNGPTINKPVPPSNNNNNNSNNNNNTGNNNNGGNGSNLCSSAPNPVCGITSQGTLVNGICNATVPADSACPAPVISSGTGFYAQPALVKSGEQTTLYWNVTNATNCTLSGGALGVLQALPLTGNHLTGAVTQKTSYTLTCKQGSGTGPSSSATAVVNLVPSFQNQ